jgi:hypothetical protein
MNAPAEQMMRTLYQLLGTRPDATRQEIEVAYGAAVRRLKPQADAGRPEALNQLRELREAYQILSDQRQRARYDRWMKPLEGTVGPPPQEAEGNDRVGLAVIIALVLIAIGAMLTAFLLLDRAVDLRIEGPGIVRQKPAEDPQQPPMDPAAREAAPLPPAARENTP